MAKFVTERGDEYPIDGCKQTQGEPGWMRFSGTVPGECNPAGDCHVAFGSKRYPVAVDLPLTQKSVKLPSGELAFPPYVISGRFKIGEGE